MPEETSDTPTACINVTVSMNIYLDPMTEDQQQHLFNSELLELAQQVVLGDYLRGGSEITGISSHLEWIK